MPTNENAMLAIKFIILTSILLPDLTNIAQYRYLKEGLTFNGLVFFPINN